MTKKIEGHFGWKKCRKIEKLLCCERSGSCVHRDSWLKAKFCAIPKPNTISVFDVTSIALINGCYWPQLIQPLADWESLYSPVGPPGDKMILRDTKWFVAGKKTYMMRNKPEPDATRCSSQWMLAVAVASQFVVMILWSRSILPECWGMLSLSSGSVSMQLWQPWHLCALQAGLNRIIAVEIEPTRFVDAWYISCKLITRSGKF